MAIIIGTSADDTLAGTSGNDYINGLAGEDTMSGGTGDDTYVVDSAADVVVEASGGGIDRVLASVSFILPVNVETLVISAHAGAINGSGNGQSNTITGNAAANSLLGGGGDDTLHGLGGNDTLIGGVGIDTMVGGAGDDVYFVNTTNSQPLDRTVENPGEGFDKVFVTVPGTYKLEANIEACEMTAVSTTGQINVLIGNDLDNVLIGGAGIDLLDGEGGADTMFGGLGDDIYVIRDPGDIVIESPSGGIDKVNVTFGGVTLPANVENGAIVSDTGLLLTGNALDNVLTGISLADTLQGGSGADTLIGDLGDDSLNGGDDTLVGGAGADRLEGGIGFDELTGGADNDLFIYVLGDGSDLVTDFEGAGIALIDVIELKNTGISSFNELLPLIGDVVGGCEIVFAAGQILSLRDISKAQLDANDFVFL